MVAYGGYGSVMPKYKLYIDGLFIFNVPF